jgi:hypothetical protein
MRRQAEHHGDGAPKVTRRGVLVSDKLKTMAGAFVPAETIQVVLKWEHVWLER